MIGNRLRGLLPLFLVVLCVVSEPYPAAGQPTTPERPSEEVGSITLIVGGMLKSRSGAT